MWQAESHFLALIEKYIHMDKDLICRLRICGIRVLNNFKPHLEIRVFFYIWMWKNTETFKKRTRFFPEKCQ